MLNTLTLLNIILSFGLSYDIILKIIIEWDICIRKPLMHIMDRCFSEICNPTLLENGGTRWDYRTDFYHRGWKQKKRNGKFRWKKKRWEPGHGNPSIFTSYYKFHPKTRGKNNYIFKSNLCYTEHISYYYPLVMEEPYYNCYNSTLSMILKSNVDAFGNVKCKFNISGFDYPDNHIHSEATKLIKSRLSKYFDTSLICKNENTNDLLSFIFLNFKF